MPDFKLLPSEIFVCDANEFAFDGFSDRLNGRYTKQHRKSGEASYYAHEDERQARVLNDILREKIR